METLDYRFKLCQTLLRNLAVENILDGIIYVIRRLTMELNADTQKCFLAVISTELSLPDLSEVEERYTTSLSGLPRMTEETTVI